jgi:hypothetical protein
MTQGNFTNIRDFNDRPPGRTEGFRRPPRAEAHPLEFLALGILALAVAVFLVVLS